MNTLDSIELAPVQGFSISAKIVDEDYYPPMPEGDNYTTEQIDAYVRGDWKYVGIIVTASRGGVELGTDSLWSVEYGSFPIDGRTVFIDPLHDSKGSLAAHVTAMAEFAVDEARKKLTELVDAGIDGSME